MKKALQISNGIALVSVITINYLSNTGLLNNTTIGNVSDNYKSLFTPAGYTFAIWGLIYLMLLGFVIYQGRSHWSKNIQNDAFVTKTGWWFVLSCLFNALWVFAWIYQYTGLSCVLIFLFLFSLLKIVINNRMELDDKPLPIIVFVWWPFVIYSGWVTVASIANTSSYLTKIGWDGFGFSDVFWTITIICIAVIINIMMIWKRNMREFALVGAWALIGIGNSNSGSYNMIAYTAFSGAALLILISLFHAYENRKTNPLVKLKQMKHSK